MRAAELQSSSNRPGWLIGDRDSHCGVICTRTQVKPVCGSDGRSYESACELQRARCRDKTLTLVPRSLCRGRNWVKIDQLPAAPAPTSASEVRDPEVKGKTTGGTPAEEPRGDPRRKLPARFGPFGRRAEKHHQTEANRWDENSTALRITPEARVDPDAGGQSKCRADRSQALDQARRPQESTFVPECNEDGTFAQVQCHTPTGYCWCVTSDGKPVSGSSVHNRTPVCSAGLLLEVQAQAVGPSTVKEQLSHGRQSRLCFTLQGRSSLEVSLEANGPTSRAPRSSGARHAHPGWEHFRIIAIIFPQWELERLSGRGSVTEKPPGPSNSGRKDDGSRPPPTMETHVAVEGDEITGPTLWNKQQENKQNSSSSRKQEKVPSCDQERQSALEEARQNSRQASFIPDCGPGGLYKAVQCHQSTGYCWCVLVDTGRPIPGTSTRKRLILQETPPSETPLSRSRPPRNGQQGLCVLDD
ncbi:SPARC-related modular calcium-binding protein 1 [Takifugu flavidus]|uniref:SPARC-related modular calcium-binding protein 1 n=1 Tax=Takifugu flavidus TaxID=433684 RepID=A0A5C6P3B8_9TELE|nr:SPARC-related modular calcium-binding protein 1 [Takifugu flavidus]